MDALGMDWIHVDQEGDQSWRFFEYGKGNSSLENMRSPLNQISHFRLWRRGLFCGAVTPVVPQRGQFVVCTVSSVIIFSVAFCCFHYFNLFLSYGLYEQLWTHYNTITVTALTWNLARSWSDYHFLSLQASRTIQKHDVLYFRWFYEF
jgi:hypothetical protein